VFKTRRWEKTGMLLWLVGCIAFIISSARAGDPYALTGAILFFIGVVAFLVPMLRNQ